MSRFQSHGQEGVKVSINQMSDIIFFYLNRLFDNYFRSGQSILIKSDLNTTSLFASNNNIIFLTSVTALIKLNNSKNIEIYSNYGKYNTINYDTIFSKNVIVNYLENKITGEYLDFSIQRNSMVISRDVVYKNLENILIADVVEVDIKTKDTKIFMYEENKKVKVKNKN